MRICHSEPKGIRRGKMMEILEWAGCATGLCGAALLALNNHYSGW